MGHNAPAITSNDGVLKALSKALGKSVIEAVEAHDEISFTVKREKLVDVLVTLRDDHEYQQLVEIAGVDYPDRAERFEVCYHMLSLTNNHRVRVKNQY